MSAAFDASLDIKSVIDEDELRDAIREQTAAGGVRRFLPVERMPAGVTTISSGEWTQPTNNTRSLLTSQSDPLGVVELIGQLAVTSEQMEAEGRDQTVLAAVRKLARNAVAVEDYLVVAGVNPTVTSGLLQSHGIAVARSSPRTARGLHDLQIGTPLPVDKLEDGRVAMTLVEGINEACTALHRQGREGPYALIVSMDVHQLLRSRTADRDVPEQLLPGDVQHVLGMRALEKNTGVVVALGGQPVALVVDGQSMDLTLSGQDAHGRHVMQLRHRFALRVRDPVALQVLKFR